MSEQDVIIDYTNHRGERRERRVRPYKVWFGESPYHKDGRQWFWTALDYEKDEERDFAVKDIHAWRPAGEEHQ